MFPVGLQILDEDFCAKTCRLDFRYFKIGKFTDEKPAGLQAAVVGVEAHFCQPGNGILPVKADLDPGILLGLQRKTNKKEGDK